MDDLSRKIIIALQGDIPLTPEPYKELAADIGISQQALLDHLEQMRENGLLKRIGAILNHRKAGFVANAMVAWCVPEERIEEVGEAMAAFNEASHIYQRPAYSEWPYNLYTMIHGETCEECEKVVEKMAHLTGIYEYEILYSTREFKKTSMRYFENSSS